MYHNTSGIQGRLLLDFQERARSQEDRIYRIFQESPRKLMTPFEVKTILDFLEGTDTPITSVRRAMTDLTKEGRLVRTRERKTEVYARPNYYWRLKYKHE